MYVFNYCYIDERGDSLIPGRSRLFMEQAIEIFYYATVMHNNLHDETYE